MLHIAVLGTGEHSTSHHGPALKMYKAERPDQIELSAVCDVDLHRAERYARLYGFVQTYDDVETMLAYEKLDGLVAVTPISLTDEIAGKLLTRGVPLLIEKPPGRNSKISSMKNYRNAISRNMASASSPATGGRRPVRAIH